MSSGLKKLNYKFYVFPCYRFEYVHTPLWAGGVGMYIHNDLNYTVIERRCDEAFQALWVSVHIANKSNGYW